MDFSRHSELLEGVVNQLIDEEALGVCFEMHRAIKLGYYELLYPEDSVYDKQPIVDVKGLDIFGSSPLSVKKNIDCICPNCSRTLGASKFAPHLEKCMGMGRNSTRLAANKKQKIVVDSEQEQSDDNEDEWNPEARKGGGGGGGGTASKKMKKEKLATSSPHRSGRGPGRPPKQHRDRGGGKDHHHHHHHHHHHNPHTGDTPNYPNAGDFHSLKPSQQMHTVHSFKGLPMEYKISLLDQICGVVSERTGRLCTRSVNCPQHAEEQRLELRSILLKERRQSLDDVGPVGPPPAKKSRSAHKNSPEGSDEVDVEAGYRSSKVSGGHGETSVWKKKSSKKGKRGHGITTATTVLHSSSML